MESLPKLALNSFALSFRRVDLTLGNGQNNSVTNLANMVKVKGKAGSGRTGLVGSALG